MIVLTHLSDLHLEDQVRPPKVAKPTPNKHPDTRPSARGHDFSAARDLSNTCRALFQDAPDMQVVVTGDLTRSGRHTEFGYAHRFLHAYWLLDNLAAHPLRVGLCAGGDAAVTIPGNHDLWGSLMVDGTALPIRVNGNALKHHFWPLPWVHALRDQAKGLEVHLIGLDSHSGLLDWPQGARWLGVSWTQVLARGAIQSDQLDGAAKLLMLHQQDARARGNLVLRVVLVHHPPSQLVESSRRELEGWLARHQVAALLTGHTHKHTFPPPGQGEPPFELRCGTTLQAGTYNMLPGEEANHFYVHQLAREGEDHVRWKTVEHWFNGQSWMTDHQPVWEHSLRSLR